MIHVGICHSTLCQVLSAKEAEVEEAGNAVASLTAVLAEKDEVGTRRHPLLWTET
jgi:hypothetical protein